MLIIMLIIISVHKLDPLLLETNINANNNTNNKKLLRIITMKRDKEKKKKRRWVRVLYASSDWKSRNEWQPPRDIIIINIIIIIISDSCIIWYYYIIICHYHYGISIFILATECSNPPSNQASQESKENFFAILYIGWSTILLYRFLVNLRVAISNAVWFMRSARACTRK